MILRRIRAHVQAENWFAVAIDFAIVVVGVFIGIQVANWNDRLAIQAQSDSYHLRLQADFETMKKDISTNVGFYEQSMEGIQVVKRILSEHEALDDDLSDAFASALLVMDSSFVPASRSETYTEMQSAGLLGLIEDKALIDALKAYDREAINAMSAWTSLIDRHTVYIEPILFRHIDYSVTKSSHWADAASIKSIDYLGMRTDPDFRSALSALSLTQSNNHAIQMVQLEHATSVLKALNQSAAP